MKKLKIWLYSLLWLAAILMLCVGAIIAWTWGKNHRPSEAEVRDQFAKHKSDYLAFVALLEKDPSVDYVGGDGVVRSAGAHQGSVPAYRDLIHKIGAVDVLVREDGSIEFNLGGSGGAICSDSYAGVRYVPENKRGVRAGWTQTAVTSLEDSKLPQENNAVASGLYVVPIEPHWFVYRFEY
jgi:hypothetical protein